MSKTVDTSHILKFIIQKRVWLIWGFFYANIHYYNILNRVGVWCTVRLGYCFTPYQRLWLYNGAHLVAFCDTLGIRRTYSRLKPTEHVKFLWYIAIQSFYFNESQSTKREGKLIKFTMTSQCPLYVIWAKFELDQTSTCSFMEGTWTR